MSWGDKEVPMRDRLDRQQSFANSCLVIAYPMAKRVGIIRKTAAVLARRNGKAADVYWQTSVQRIVWQLQRAGFAEDQIRKCIAEFQDAVQVELCAASSSTNGGDCA